MNNLNEDLILKYLVENINKDLYSKYSIKDILILDYCYKKDEQIPKDYFSGFISKVTNKHINNSFKIMSLDEINLIDCLFLESYKSLLSNQTKNLIKDIKTAKDFKAVAIIDTLSKKVNNSESILSSSDSLDLKIFNLAQAYKESNFEKEIKKVYDSMREYSLKINAKLKEPFNKELIGKIKKFIKELDKKAEVYSKYPDKSFVPEIQSLIRETRGAIDTKFRDYTSNIDKEYNIIKRNFEDGIWDNEKRINQLICLRSELKDIKSKYQLIFHKERVGICNSLDCKIKESINNYNYVKDLKEGFKDVKRKVYNYHNEINSIFCEKIDFSSVRKLNRIYADLKRLSDKSFPSYVPLTWQDNYYSNLGKAIGVIKQKCIKRVNNLANQSSKYRQKVDGSFISWQTKKFTEKLDEYNTELGAWSKCQII